MSGYNRGIRKPGHFHLLRFEEAHYGQLDRRIPHRHDFFEIVWLREAQGRVLSDFRSHPVWARTLFFASPGQVHSWQFENEARGEIISFTPEFFAISTEQPGILAKMPFLYSTDFAPLLYLAPQDAAVVDEVFLQLRGAAAPEAPGRDDIVRAYLTILLSRARQYFAQKESSVRSPVSDGEMLVHRFKLCLEEHFLELLEVKEYAKLLQISRSYLNESVRRHTGQSASELIHERLLLEAKRLLVHSSKTVSEIGYELRFHDPSYFGRFFRKYTQVSPGTYRAHNQRDSLAS